MSKLLQIGTLGCTLFLASLGTDAQIISAQAPAQSQAPSQAQVIPADQNATYRETAVYQTTNNPSPNNSAYAQSAIYPPALPNASNGNPSTSDVDFDIFAKDQFARDPIRLAQNTSTIAPPKDSVLLPAGAPATSQPGPGDRSFLQGISMRTEWVPQLEEDSLAQSNVNLAVKLGMPLPFIGGPLLVTPSYGLQMLDGPTTTDVPARLHEFQMSFATFQKINPKWMVSAIVNLGLYADDYSLDTGDAFRTSGFLMGIYTHSPSVQWVFGVAALNRDDIPVIPIVGVTIDHQWVRYELTFPRPRIAWRLPGCTPSDERIVYLGGDLGGGAWAVQRTSGETDTLNLSRYGLLIGYEQSTSKRNKISYELGYLFNREIEFESNEEEIDLDDSFFARINFSF